MHPFPISPIFIRFWIRVRDWLCCGTSPTMHLCLFVWRVCKCLCEVINSCRSKKLVRYKCIHVTVNAHNTYQMPSSSKCYKKNQWTDEECAKRTTIYFDGGTAMRQSGVLHSVSCSVSINALDFSINKCSPCIWLGCSLPPLEVHHHTIDGSKMHIDWVWLLGVGLVKSRERGKQGAKTRVLFLPETGAFILCPKSWTPSLATIIIQTKSRHTHTHTNTRPVRGYGNAYICAMTTTDDYFLLLINQIRASL